MKPRTEELLYVLLWTADGLMRPTWRNLNDSFESWAWRQGLGRRLAELENAQILERHPEPDLKRVVRLTEHGRRLALGGRDPMAQWSRPWDGLWRLVLFDVPTQRHDLRQQLLRVLRRSHFGYLQNSVWISPDPVVDVRKALGGSKVQADAFLVMEGRPAAGESDREIVAAAWDFLLINQRYQQYLAVLARVPTSPARMQDWTRQENAAWKAALAIDPLLPCGLLPAGYLGEKALQARRKLFAHLAAATTPDTLG
jgi:phenylacetic acid degradation operon negative regulatory protein